VRASPSQCGHRVNVVTEYRCYRVRRDQRGRGPGRTRPLIAARRLVLLNRRSASHTGCRRIAASWKGNAEWLRQAVGVPDTRSLRSCTRVTMLFAIRIGRDEIRRPSPLQSDRGCPGRATHRSPGLSDSATLGERRCVTRTVDCRGQINGAFPCSPAIPGRTLRAEMPVVQLGCRQTDRRHRAT
jgi:hypothetical protein